MDTVDKEFDECLLGENIKKGYCTIHKTHGKENKFNDAVQNLMFIVA